MTLSGKLKDAVIEYDFDWLEEFLGAAVPNELKQIYVSEEVLELHDIIVDEENVYFALNHFLPQNPNTYQNYWPGSEGRLLIACDGGGNEYHAEPSEQHRVVYFFDHETGESKSLGIDISTFIAKARQWKDVE